FSEEKEARGFVLADVSPSHTDWQHVPTPSRPFLTIRAELGVGCSVLGAREGQAEDRTPNTEHPTPDVDPTEELLAAIERHAAQIPGSIMRVVYSLPDGKPPIR